MHRRLQLLFAAVLLAVHIMATAAVDSKAGAAAMPGLHVLRRVEEDVAMMSNFEQGVDEEAYPKRRVLQGGGSISYGALTASKAACYGPCPGRGQPYTGRGCQAIYMCRS
jgi:hypothetical protein